MLELLLSLDEVSSDRQELLLRLAPKLANFVSVALGVIPGDHRIRQYAGAGAFGIGQGLDGSRRTAPQRALSCLERHAQRLISCRMWCQTPSISSAPLAFLISQMPIPNLWVDWMSSSWRTSMGQSGPALSRVERASRKLA